MGYERERKRGNSHSSWHIFPQPMVTPLTFPDLRVRS